MKYILYIYLIIGILYSCNKEEEIRTVEYAYNAFPDILFTRNGKLICVFYNGWHHESIPKKKQTLQRNGGRLMITESLDSGKTWSKSRILIDTQLDDRDPSLVQLEDGRILCNFFGYKRRGSEAGAGIFIIESYDDGITWSEPRFIISGHATTSPIRKIGNNLLALTTYSINGGCFIFRSSDNGKTWQSPIQIDKNFNGDFSEPDVILFNNILYAVLRSDTKNMHYSESFDNGLKWSPPEDIGFPGASPYLFNFADSILILGHRIPSTSIKQKKEKNTEWSKNLIIDHNNQANGAYPSIARITESQLMISYYREQVKDLSSTIIIRALTLNQGGLSVSPDFEEINYKEIKTAN